MSVLTLKLSHSHLIINGNLTLYWWKMDKNSKNPRMLKNPTVVFSWSRNHRAPPQKAKLPDPTHLSLFPVAIKICWPHYPCLPSHFSFHFMFILSSTSCSSPKYNWNIAARALNSNNQSINQSKIVSIYCSLSYMYVHVHVWLVDLTQPNLTGILLAVSL